MSGKWNLEVENADNPVTYYLMCLSSSCSGTNTFSTIKPEQLIRIFVALQSQLSPYGLFLEARMPTSELDSQHD